MNEKSEAKSKVILLPCSSYDEEAVYRRLSYGIGLLGGIGHFVKPEEKILLKPNFLVAAEASKAITTHPSVSRAMFRILSENGYAHVSYGDSPGHGTNEAALKKLELTADMEKYRIQAADMEHEVLTEFPDGLTAKSFYFTKAVAEADAIIGLCKMKTHMLEKITGAVKNAYGFICGYRKAAGHVSYPNATVFARMLCDIHRCTKPRLHIMDGIIAMEGNGPASGNPVAMNLLLISEDPVAIDTVFARLVHLDPELVPTITQGVNMGVGRSDAAALELVVAECPDEAGWTRGEAVSSVISMKELVERFGNPSFDVDRTGKKKNFLSRYSDLMTELARRPAIDDGKCIRCGICVSHCPVPGKAVDFRKGKGHAPVYDYRKCIRCYCCQEMCPQHAIHVRGLLKK